MKNQYGYTLVEVVIASMLLGMVFLAASPLLFTGYRAVKREQTKTEAEMVGDRVFDRIVSELRNADLVYFGTYEELERAYHEDADAWESLDLEPYELGFEIKIAEEAVESNWIRLTIVLEKEEEVAYQREELVSLLNQGLSAPFSEEGNDEIMIVDSDRKEDWKNIKIWYWKAED